MSSDKFTKITGDLVLEWGVAKLEDYLDEDYILT